jgi:hypothetical protein
MRPTLAFWSSSTNRAAEANCVVAVGVRRQAVKDTNSVDTTHFVTTRDIRLTWQREFAVWYDLDVGKSPDRSFVRSGHTLFSQLLPSDIRIRLCQLLPLEDNDCSTD